ncbi:MAG TPA: hypothetical protein VMJ10_04680 [Kofleriaceae bacterium]|nr:hypothetical protein [Kofleriaceae bacterium]
MAALKRALDGRPTVIVASAVALLGAIGTAIGLAVEPRRGFAAYLAAWCAVAFVAIGGYVVLLIGYAANARWPAAVRRLGEAAAASLPVLALLFAPMLVAMARVWPWVHPGPEHVHAVAVKAAYLSPAFFVVRALAYFALLIVPAELLRRWSRRRDDAPEANLDRERVLASAMLPVTGLVLTFAAFDWLMSLQPDWWSAAFGFYIITGALQAGLAATAVLAWLGVATGAMPLAPAHFRAIGRLLHAFTILWAYIAYFQAMLIQIANLPREVTFYIARLGSGWQVVTIVLAIARFVVPFVLLFSRRLKQRAGYVAGIAFVILFGEYLDMWWLVVPRVARAPVPSWTDVCALAAIGGAAVAVAAWRTRGASLLPVGDPYLDAAMAYEAKY